MSDIQTTDLQAEDIFCTCEWNRIAEHDCPLDGDLCNCCVYCEEKCKSMSDDDLLNELLG